MIEEKIKHHVVSLIEGLASKYKYRPLPKAVREEVTEIYKKNLNGFENHNRSLKINGMDFARGFTRVVIGDYGPYVEFNGDDVIVPLRCQPGQEWRMDEDYLSRVDLNIKYRWYTFAGKKVYHQVGPVKYADYVVGQFYVSVYDFD